MYMYLDCKKEAIETKSCSFIHLLFILVIFQSRPPEMAALQATQLFCRDRCVPGLCGGSPQCERERCIVLSLGTPETWSNAPCPPNLSGRYNWCLSKRTRTLSTAVSGSLLALCSPPFVVHSLSFIQLATNLHDRLLQPCTLFGLSKEHEKKKPQRHKGR